MIAGLVALATVLVGIEKVGGREIAPGPETHFASQIDSSGGAPTMVLRTDPHGDLTGWLELVLALPKVARGEYRASLSTGEPLAINARPLGVGLWALDLSNPRADSDARARDPFVWRSGVTIGITRAGTQSFPALQDWTLHLKDNDSDSATRALWRARWLVLSLGILAVLLVGSVVLLVLGKEPPEEAKPLPTPEELVDSMINVLQGEDETRTARMRAVLHAMRTGVSREQALLAAGANPKSVAERAMSYNAVLELAGHIGRYVAEMIAASTRLSALR